MTSVGHLSFPADHPCLRGHFPGRPVVPGALLLAAVFRLLEAAFPGEVVIGAVQVKFSRPVLPGEAVAVSCGPRDNCRVAFAGAVVSAWTVRGVAVLGRAQGNSRRPASARIGTA